MSRTALTSYKPTATTAMQFMRPSNIRYHKNEVVARYTVSDIEKAWVKDFISYLI